MFPFPRNECFQNKQETNKFLPHDICKCGKIYDDLVVYMSDLVNQKYRKSGIFAQINFQIKIVKSFDQNLHYNYNIIYVYASSVRERCPLYYFNGHCYGVL